MTLRENNQAAYNVFVAAAIMVFIGGLALIWQPLYFLAMILLPLPLSLLIIRGGLFQGLGALMVATVMLALAVGSVSSILLFALQFGSVGVVIGLLLKNKTAVDQSIAVLFFLALFLGVLNVLVFYQISGGASEVAAIMSADLEKAADLLLQSGQISEADKSKFMETIPSLSQWIQMLLPGVTGIWTVLTTMLTFFVTLRVMDRLHDRRPGAFKYSHWQLPWYSIWLLIAGLALFMAGEYYALKYLGALGSNFLLLAAFVFFMQGLAVLIYFLQTWKISPFFKTVIILAAVFYFPFTVILMLSMGMADPLANLRRLPRNEDNEVKGGKE